MTPPVIVIGGYGTFGSLACRELATLGIATTVAGRDAARARELATILGEAHDGIAVDVRDPGSCERALEGRRVAVSCAGPFGAAGDLLAGACAARGCHYVDIAEDRGHARAVAAMDGAFASAGAVAVTGCSSLPAISAALALHATAGGPHARIARVRVTLFIGNDNPKGAAAVTALVTLLGRPIEAPWGSVRGFHAPERVELPPPFGPRTVHAFESPDIDLMPALLQAREVAVKVGFESRAVQTLFALAARAPWSYGPRAASALARLAGLAPRWGCSGGAVMVEAFAEDGRVLRASATAPEQGQRMAALPAALVARELLQRGEGLHPGVRLPWEVLSPASLLGELAARSVRIAKT